MKFLILVPAYNEEKNIEKTIIDIRKKVSGDYDILVINDGSSDKTLSVLKKCKVIILSHPFNMGYGVAIQTGYKYALENDYDLVVQIDADGQHDSKYVNEMVVELFKKKLDVLIGSRFILKNSYSAPPMRRIGMVVFGKIVSIVTKRTVTDSTSGYQIIHKNTLKFLVSDVFPCDYPDADLLIMLYFAGYKVDEYPVIMYKSPTGKSMHSSLIKNFYYVFKMALSIFTIILRKVTKLSTI